MTRKSSTIIGVVLLLFGVLALIYQGIPYAQEEHVAQLGPLEVRAEEKKSLPIPPIVGGLFLAAGLVVLILGRKRG